MELYEKNVAAVQEIEAKLMETACRLEAATNNFLRFEDGGDLKQRAGERMARLSIEVRNLRRDYAQATVNAYATGMTTNGQILWS
jgi:exonuclease VII small subunit